MTTASGSHSLARPRQILLRVGHFVFGLSLTLSLLTPTWANSLFTRWPIRQAMRPDEQAIAVGWLNLLPLLLLFCWSTSRRLGGPARPWRWGPRALVWPLAGITALALLNLDYRNQALFAPHLAMLALVWLTYLYAVNERPQLTPYLAIVLAVQGLAAVGQFWKQGSLGLVGLGEVRLDPAVEGISVLAARGRHWLRAYGLTTHPNLLGAILTFCLLFVLPAVGRLRGLRRFAVYLACALGLAGLLLSFSRSSWLAFIAGIITWRLLGGKLGDSREIVSGDSPVPIRRQSRLLLLLALAPAALLLVAYRDLAFSRIFALGSAVEAQSIDRRLADANLAWQLVRDEPLQGVGMGNYLSAAHRYDPAADRVHNVTLFAAAELGVIGLALWLWLMIAPLWPLLQNIRASATGKTDHLKLIDPTRLAPWIAMIVINLFDTMLWLSNNWQTGLLFALLLAHQTWHLTLGEELPEAKGSATAIPAISQ